MNEPLMKPLNQFQNISGSLTIQLRQSISLHFISAWNELVGHVMKASCLQQ